MTSWEHLGLGLLTGTIVVQNVMIILLVRAWRFWQDERRLVASIVEREVATLKRQLKAPPPGTPDPLGGICNALLALSGNVAKVRRPQG